MQRQLISAEVDPLNSCDFAFDALCREIFDEFFNDLIFNRVVID